MSLADFSSLAQWVPALSPLAAWSGQEVTVRRGSGIRSLWARIRSWRARRETLSALHALDCRTLKDLGINPREIESLVYSDHDDRIRCYDPDWWRR